jgi:lipoprotein-releasing system ATP-binding protein
MATTVPLLRLAEVSKSYESPQGGAGLVILNGISLDIQSGESLAIMGPSGSGKSTLLQIIGTLDQPTSGHVFLAGRELNRLTPEEIAGVRNTELGFVFQAHFLLPQCTVLENVLVPTLAHPKKAKRTQKPPDNARAVSSMRPETVDVRAVRLLNRVGLGARLNHRPGELSGGKRQRVAVVRALINQPKLLLADEPTGALDQTSAEQLGELLVELNREEGVALIVVTHARPLAERIGKIWQLRDGRLV